MTKNDLADYLNGRAKIADALGDSKCEIETGLALQAAAYLRGEAEPQCTCVRFTRDNATVTMHLKDDPNCPMHGGQVKGATEGLTLTGLPSPVEPTREHPTTDPATAYRTTCNHPPEARGLTGCLLCGAVL